MNVTVKRLPKSRVELKVEVPAEDMAGFFASAYQELAASVDIPGFRKGYAPKPIVKETVGEARLIAEAVEQALPKTYHQAVTQEGLVPIAEPEVHVEAAAEDKPFVYRAEVDVVPDVDPVTYQKVRVSKKKFAPKSVEDKELAEALERLRKAATVPKPVDRGAQKGDWVEIGYAGSVNNVPQENLKNDHHPLVLGEGTLIAGFEDQLIGLKKDEQKKFTVPVPRRDGKEQKAEFTVKMLQVAELIVPELDDSLAERFKAKDVAELRAKVKEQLVADREREARQQLEAAVIEAVVKPVKLELPETLIEREVSRRVETLSEQLQAASATLDEWLKHRSKTLEEFKSDLRPAAETSVKTGLVLREIADREGFIKSGQPATEDALQKTVERLIENAIK